MELFVLRMLAMDRSDSPDDAGHLERTLAVAEVSDRVRRMFPATIKIYFILVVPCTAHPEELREGWDTGVTDVDGAKMYVQYLDYI